MISRLFFITILCITHLSTYGQDDPGIDSFPYFEDFDSITPPALPDGWKTSTNRTDAGDFITEQFQGNNRLSTRNATIEQYITTPGFDFTGYRPITISFSERRSGTFGAVIEVATIINVVDTLIIGTTELLESNTFVAVTFDLPASLLNETNVRFLLRIVPAAEGATGTLRIDNIRIDAVIQKIHDLRVTGIHTFPPLPTTNDDLAVRVAIHNAGLAPASGFDIGLHLDEENLRNEVTIPEAIAPGDSLQITIPLPALKQNIHTARAYVSYDRNQGTDTSFSTGIHVTAPVNSYPWYENFDYESETLPLSWRTSTKENIPAASLTSSVVYTGNRAILMSNATTEQYLILPPFEISDGVFESLTFFERRTGTFDATLAVEISTDLGENFQEYNSFVHPGETAYVERRLDLDGSLKDAKILYIRLRLAGDGRGSTGTIRLDAFTANLRLKHDIVLSALTIDPPLPVTGDDITAQVSLMNRGLEAASGFTIGISSEENTLYTEEYKAGVIEPFDSVTFSVSIPPLHSGLYRIRAFVSYDNNGGTDTSLTSAIHVADPVRSYPWYEQFDYESEMIPPNWRSSEFNSSSDALLTSSVVHSGERALIMANPSREQYLILPPFRTSDGTVQGITFFERRTAAFDAAMKVEVSMDRGRQFSEHASFSHSGETAYILRKVTFEDRFSENDALYVRLRFTGDGTGTTGTIRMDSFTAEARLNHDIALTSMELNPEFPFPGDDITIVVGIKNSGGFTAQTFRLRLYRLSAEVDNERELIGTYNYSGQLMPSDSTHITFPIENISSGYSIILAELDYDPDMQTDNNTLEKEIFIRYPRNTLVVNEILYHTIEGQPEFIEIFNPGNRIIDLRDWSIRDRETPGGHINRYTLSDTSLLLEPGYFAVLSADSSVFDWFQIDGMKAHIISAQRRTLGLSSQGDEVLLLDPAGSVVDSISYDPSWHHPDVYERRGRSLERISPFIDSQNGAHWSTSADLRGGTPGSHNSIFTETPVSTASIDVHPNPFSPNNDGFEDYTIISYNLPHHTAMVRLRIFDSLGRQVRTLLNNQPSGPEGQVIWDGRNDLGRPARLGIYIILLEAYDSERSGLTQLKSTLVVADRL
jgi:hypothetical protein